MKKRKSRLHKFLAVALVVTVVGAVIPSTTIAAEEQAAVEVLAQFSFDDMNAGLTGGKAKATGNAILQDSYTGADKALYLDGTAEGVLKITDLDGGSLLTGAQELTISFEAKADRGDTNWWFYAAPNENGQSWLYEHYIGIMQENGTLMAERYDNNNGRPEVPNASVGEGWVHIDVVYSDNDTALYVDGIEKSRVESNYRLTDILKDNSVLYVGKANWGDGEYCKGWIDNLTIYSSALNVQQLHEAVPETYRKIAVDKA